MAKTQTKPAGPKANTLYDAYVACELPLRRFISRYFTRSEDIDDLAQETFLRAFDAERSTEISSPKAYLFRVARNMALRELGKKSRQLTSYLEDAVDNENIVLDEASAEQELIAQQKLEHCCRALAGLPEQCRRVFLLRKIHAYSHKQIAVELGISTRTVEKHITKGVSRFTDYIDKQDSLGGGTQPVGSTSKHPWS